MMKVFGIFLIYFHLIINIYSSLAQKTVPKFSQDTLRKAENIILFDNLPLNTVILKVNSTTYQEGLPIIYSLINAEPYFRINSNSGDIILFSPIDKIKNFQFTIVAKDSAVYPDQQSSFLTANVTVISSENNPPIFNNEIPYYVSVLDLISIGSVVFDNIYVTDKNFGQNGIAKIYCDTGSAENLEASTSCEFFKVETQMLDMGTYRCLIKLLKKLDYMTKKSFVITITAQIGWLKSSSNLVVEVKKPDSLIPKFVNSSYFFKTYSTDSLNTFEVTVINIDLTKPSNISFVLTDPKNYFTTVTSPSKCINSSCIQQIKLNTNVIPTTQYKMNVRFIQNLENHVLLASTVVYVLIKSSKSSSTRPVFLNSPYEFFVRENIEQNGFLRNVSINVYEPENLPFYNSGFTVELLNRDFTIANDTFEVIPNYGIGLLVSSLKLKPNAILDYESSKRRYDFILKTTSRSNINLFSYTNLTIFIQDYNEFSPYFESLLYTKFINEPEKYKIDDVLTRVNAFDKDGDDSVDSLTYSLIGPYQDKFKIDQFGQIRLLKAFDFSIDELTFYNLTILVTDQGGLSNHTNVILYFNLTASIKIKNILFECELYGVRSELNPIDKFSLLPELYLPINSPYPLKFHLFESNPIVNELEIDSNSGKIYFKSPLNYTFLQNYDRTSLNVKVYQIQSTISESLYLSSITCPVTIYLKSLKETSIARSEPYFLRQYFITINQDSVFSNLPLIKVEAVSTNTNNQINLFYNILNNPNNLFSIDSTQGFIYSRNNFGLESKIYELIVQATDQITKLSSTTTVRISVTETQTNQLTCDVEYLIIKLNPKRINKTDQTEYIGKINCKSNSMFNQSKINYDMSLPYGVYDCNGFKINYIPNIGIDSSNGQIVAFDELTREMFCDATFAITVRKDDSTVFIPFRLILIDEDKNRAPIFVNPSINITYLSNYAHIGSYITTVTAYDSISRQIIENYSIISEKTSPVSNKNYFKIDSLTGVITLNNLPFVDRVELIVSATSNQGFTSYTQINIDLSSYFSNFYSNIYFEPLSPNSIVVYNDKFYYDSIYKVIPSCFRNYDLSKQVSCDLVEFSIDYYKFNDSEPNFIIDKYSGNLYLTTSKPEKTYLQSTYLVIISVKSSLSNYPDRFVRMMQKNFTILVDSLQSDRPMFEFDNYSVQILDTTPLNTNILSIKYLSNRIDSEILLSFEQRSNFQVEDYFYLTYSKKLKAIYIMIKKSPIPIDKPEINFGIRINNSSLTKISVKLLSSYLSQSMFDQYPIFTIPSWPSYLITLNLSNFGILNNTAIFEFQTLITNKNQFIVYRILNEQKTPFYIQNSFLRIIYPFPDFIDQKKLSYLLLIEARNILNPSYAVSYTTLDIRVNNLVQNLPYFIRDTTSGPLNLVIFENVTLNQVLFDLTPYVFKPGSNVYYYVFNKNSPSIVSDTFFVNSNKNSLEIKKNLDANNQNFYEIFVYATDQLSYSNVFYNPTFNNTALLYLNIKVLKISENTTDVIDTTSFSLIEELVPIDFKIGYVKSIFEDVMYTIESCEFVSKSIIYNDIQFCNLFRIDSKTGFIYTKNSNFSPFKNNYFKFKIAITSSLQKIFSDFIVYIVDYQEKSRFLFNSLPLHQTNPLIELKNQINAALNNEYKGEFYFEYHEFKSTFISSVNSELDVCFYLIKQSEKVISSFKETIKILSELDSIKKIYEKFFIQKIEQCSNREASSLVNLYDKFGKWILKSESIAMITLTALCLFLVILVLIILNICWASHMRQSLLAPEIEFDSVETLSNDLLIED